MASRDTQSLQSTLKTGNEASKVSCSFCVVKTKKKIIAKKCMTFDTKNK